MYYRGSQDLIPEPFIVRETPMEKPIQMALESKLTEALEAQYLEVINESANHNVPAGSESHFKVIAAASCFEGKRAVARHQMVYGVLAHELDAGMQGGGVHALALHLYTPAEWAQQQQAPESPECLGASKS